MEIGNLHIYTAGGACVTSLGMNLEENVSNIKAGKSGIQKHEDKNLSAEAFYGAIINKAELEKACTLTGYNGIFTALEKMFLIALKDVLKDYQAYKIGRASCRERV